MARKDCRFLRLLRLGGQKAEALGLLPNRHDRLRGDHCPDGTRTGHHCLDEQGRRAENSPRAGSSF